MEECVFCKIIKKEIPSRLEFENEDCLVFHDIRPRARIHLLIIPKKHINSLREVTVNDELLLGKMVMTASNMAKKFGLEDYNFSINTGEKAGQEIFHLHYHLKSID